MQNEALNILSSRLARGEISEDEYDRLKAKLVSPAPNSDPEPALSAPPPAAKSSSSASGKSENKIATWIGGIAGLYLGACVLLAFVASPSSAAAAVNDGCRQSGGSTIFCQCYATEAIKGYSFLSAPLWFAGIGRVSTTQANYTCNSR